MKSYRIYFASGKDIQVEAEHHRIQGDGRLELYNGSIFHYGVEKPFYIVASGQWVIVDVAPEDDE